MKKVELNLEFTHATYDELNAQRQALIDAAREANTRSYAPYSHFNVGAAILLENGEVITGANQENVAYPSGTCAERSACFYAHAQFPNVKFKAIAIAAWGTDGKEVDDPIAPCGACRQALLEYETLYQSPIEVMLVGSKNILIIPSVKDLLPLAFAHFE